MIRPLTSAALSCNAALSIMSSHAHDGIRLGGMSTRHAAVDGDRSRSTAQHADSHIACGVTTVGRKQCCRVWHLLPQELRPMTRSRCAGTLLDARGRRTKSRECNPSQYWLQANGMFATTFIMLVVHQSRRREGRTRAPGSWVVSSAFSSLRHLRNRLRLTAKVSTCSSLNANRALPTSALVMNSLVSQRRATSEFS